MKDGFLGSVALQLESSLAGTPVGSAYIIPGLREWEYEREHTKRSISVGVWRQEKAQSDFGAAWNGRLDIELGANVATSILLGLALELVSQIDADGIRTLTYRLPRAASRQHASARFLVTSDNGPWVVFGGVMITQLRLTIRAQQMVHLSADWIASSRVSYPTDPSWTLVDGRSQPVVATHTLVAIDGTPHLELIELSVGVGMPAEFVNYDHSGSATEAVEAEIETLSGSMVEYTDGVLPEKAESGTSFELDLTCLDIDGETVLSINVPVCRPQSGEIEPVTEDEVTDTVPWKGIEAGSDRASIVFAYAL